MRTKDERLLHAARAEIMSLKFHIRRALEREDV